jgi:hypothetical protein
MRGLLLFLVLATPRVSLAVVQLPCAGVDDTVVIQAAIDADTRVNVTGRCVLNAAVGVHIPSGRTIDATGASFATLPGCAVHCRAFETVPGASAVLFYGGQVLGDLLSPNGLGFLIDSASGVSVIGTRFANWKTDGIVIAGNRPSSNVLLSAVTIEGSGRNHISITNAQDVTVEHSALRHTQPGADPGAGIDVEPNVGEGVDALLIADTETSDNEVGFYLHPGKGRPGTDYRVIGCRALQNRKYGLVLNSVIGGAVLGNTIDGAPVSVGGATLETLATDVTLSKNLITSTRGLILAGVQDSKVVGNVLVGGRLTIVALGVSGEMIVLRNELR